MDEPWIIPLPIQLLLLLAIVLGSWLLLRPIIGEHFKGGQGWSRLATVYATDLPPPHQCLHRQTLQVGSVIYKRCVTVGFTTEGLYLAPAGPGAILRQAPLLIPWSQIRGIEPARLFWQKAALLSIGSPTVGTLTALPDLFEPMRSRLQPSLRDVVIA